MESYVFLERNSIVKYSIGAFGGGVFMRIESVLPAKFEQKIPTFSAAFGGRLFRSFENVQKTPDFEQFPCATPLQNFR